MTDHRNPSWWEGLAARWEAAVLAWGAVAATLGGLAVKAVRWWHKLRGATQRLDTPPQEVLDTIVALGSQLRDRDRKYDELRALFLELNKRLHEALRELAAAQGQVKRLEAELAQWRR